MAEEYKKRIKKEKVKPSDYKRKWAEKHIPIIGGASPAPPQTPPPPLLPPSLPGSEGLAGPEGPEGPGRGEVSTVVGMAVGTTANQFSQSRDRELMSGTVLDSDQQITTDKQKFFDTVSCPCNSRAIELDNGSFGCERNNFGEITIINPISVYNHKIESAKPKIGDKWRCVGVSCVEDDFEWNTLHVISVVEKNSDDSFTSLLNSTMSTSNCYIPKSEIYAKNNEIIWTENRLQELYQSAVERLDGKSPITPNSGFNIQDVLSYTNKIPIFETSEQAQWYNLINQVSADPTRVTVYNKDGISGFISGVSTGYEKLINSFKINKKNILKRIGNDFSIINYNPSISNNTTVDSNGGFLTINIRGVNSPIFTLKVQNSTGRSVVKEKIKNITSNDYNAKIEIPALTLGKTSEIYTIELSPAANARFDLGDGIPVVGIVKVKIYQYKRPTFTFANTASTITNAATTTATTTFTGNVMSRVSSPKSFTPETHVTTITRSSGTRNYYVKQLPKFEDLITKNNIIRKTILENNDGELLIAPNPETESGTLDIPLYEGDVLVGMSVEGKVTKTKEVKGFINLNENEDPCYDFEDDIYTNRFEIINSPNDIFSNMVVTGEDSDGNSFTTILESVDSTVEGFSCITLANKYILNKDTILTFTYFVRTEVEDVKDTGNGQVITLSNSVSLPANTDITFENGDTSRVKGHINHTISGKEEITITTTIDEVKFGREDVTFTLNVDDLITDTPIIKDISLTVGKDTTRDIDFAQGSNGNTDNLVVAIVTDPKNGAIVTRSKGGLLTYPTTKTYTPNAGFTGKDRIGFTLGDGVVTSEEKSVFITIK